jgi:hypothetical protein
MSEQIDYEDMFSAWMLLHPQWKRYEGDPQNRIALIQSAMKYRPCPTAFDRAFSEVKFSLVRTDGKTDIDDTREAAERAEEADRNVEVTAGDYEYIASLAKAQVSEAYYADLHGEFARVYRSLMRTHGFQAPAPRATRRSA